MKLGYRRLDVFTQRPLAGTPLIVAPDADRLDAEGMLGIAREFNLPTVFLLRPRDPVNTARLRVFSPARELAFAGEATLAGAALIACERARDMLAAAPLRLALEQEAGLVVCEVFRANKGLHASFVAPRLPDINETPLDARRLAAAIGLEGQDIGFDGHRPQLAGAETPFAFIPVAGLEALNRAKPDFAALAAALPFPPAASLYTKETSDPANHVQARVFVRGCGAREDPAAASAAIAFAAVAQKFERPEDGEHVIAIEQGHALGRPGLIALTLRVEHGALTQVELGGASVISGEGVLSL